MKIVCSCQLALAPAENSLRGITMNEEMKDFDLDRSASKGPADPSSTGSPKWPWALGAAVVVLLVVVVVWMRRDDVENGEPAVTPQTAEHAAQQPTELEGKLELGTVPSLSQSDEWLREIVKQLSSQPELAQWLVTDELIRTIVVVVDNIAEGTTPSNHLEHIKPSEGFKVRESDGRYFVDAASYRRYDTLTAVIESLDTNGTAEVYRAIYPLLQEAYVDLGYPGQSFEAALRRAMQRLLATPVIDQPIELEAKISGYEFKDPAQQELSSAAKQFLRLGPDNLRRLQGKVRELARAVELDVGN